MMLLVSIITSLTAALIEFLGRGKLIVIIPYTFINPLLISLPRLIYSKTRIGNFAHNDWLVRVEQVIFAILAFNVPGSLVFHDAGIQYDWFLHFVEAFLSFVLLTLFYSLYLKMKGSEVKRDDVVFFVFTVLLLAVFLWEGYQFLIDNIFGTSLFFDPAQTKLIDFRDDILFGLAGLMVAVLYVKRYFNKFLLLLK